MTTENTFKISREGSEWLSLEEAAPVLGYPSGSALLQAINRGQLDDLPAMKRGKGRTSPWLFHRAAIEQYLKDNHQTIGEIKERE
jgi:hypothetical protein